MSAYFSIGNTVRQQWTNLHTFPQGVEGVILSLMAVTTLVNYAEVNSYVKILIRRLWGKRDLKGGLVALALFRYSRTICSIRSPLRKKEAKKNKHTPVIFYYGKYYKILRFTGYLNLNCKVL